LTTGEEFFVRHYGDFKAGIGTSRDLPGAHERWRARRRRQSAKAVLCNFASRARIRASCSEWRYTRCRYHDLWRVVVEVLQRNQEGPTRFLACPVCRGVVYGCKELPPHITRELSCHRWLLQIEGSEKATIVPFALPIVYILGEHPKPATHDHLSLPCATAAMTVPTAPGISVAEVTLGRLIVIFLSRAGGSNRSIHMRNSVVSPWSASRPCACVQPSHPREIAVRGWLCSGCQLGGPFHNCSPSGMPPTRFLDVIRPGHRILHWDVVGWIGPQYPAGEAEDATSGNPGVASPNMQFDSRTFTSPVIIPRQVVRLRFGQTAREPGRPSEPAVSRE
jgi:hypothetical protein